MLGTFRIVGFDEDGVQGPPNHLRLVCLIEGGGKLAIWGREGASGNIEKVLQAGPRCTVDREYGKPGAIQAEKHGHTHWVGPHHKLQVTPARIEADQPRVTSADLDVWRRSVVQLVASLDRSQGDPKESIAARIGRLTKGGLIPREVAPLMRAITEMRNTSLYEGKVLSAVETAAVLGAWAAIREWASKQGLQLES